MTTAGESTPVRGDGHVAGSIDGGGRRTPLREISTPLRLFTPSRRQQSRVGRTPRKTPGQAKVPPKNEKGGSEEGIMGECYG